MTREKKVIRKERGEQSAPANRTRLRVYLSSLLSLILCAVLFLGTTIAWFTDEVGSKGNRILIGELDLSLLYGTENVDLADPGNAGQAVLNETVKWAPGHLELINLAVQNNGDIPFDYSLGMRLLQSDGKHISQETAATEEINPYTFAEYFDVYAIDEKDLPDNGTEPTIASITAGGSKWEFAGKLSEILKGKSMYDNKLTAKAEENTTFPQRITWFAVYMNPSAPSTYIGKKLENIYIYLRACQTIEDIAEPVLVSNQEELEKALAVGGNIVLTQDISIGAETLKILKNRTVVLNLNGKTLSGNGGEIFNVTGNLTLESGNVECAGIGQIANVESEGVLTINSGSYTASEGTVFDVNGGTLQYNGGSATAQNSCVVVRNGGKLTVNSGVLTSTNASVVVSEDNGNIIINDGILRASTNESEGNIACGIEQKGSGTTTIYTGTFHIQDGVGVCVKAGSLKLEKGIIFKHSMTGEAAKTGVIGIDAAGPFTAGSDVVQISGTTVEQPEEKPYEVTEVTVGVEATP